MQGVAQCLDSLSARVLIKTTEVRARRPGFESNDRGSGPTTRARARRPGFESNKRGSGPTTGVRVHLLLFRNLGNFVDPHCLCLSEDVPKAVYSVYARGN